MKNLAGKSINHCHEPLVLIHGWGSDKSIWQPLTSALQGQFECVAIDLPGFGVEPGSGPEKFCFHSFCQKLMSAMPAKAIYVGWSLGGMIAVHLAHHFPSRVSRVITLASNLKFIADVDWPKAMAVETFKNFKANFRQWPEKTLERFSALQAKGDEGGRQLVKTLRKYQNLHDVDLGDAWLTVLATLDNRKKFSALCQPGLHIFAANDELVPAVVAVDFTQLNKLQKVKVEPGSGHALPISRPHSVVQTIREFIESTEYYIDKQRLAQSFSRAATSYDSVAQLQRQVGATLLKKMPETIAAPILDLGCGTGYFCKSLMERYPGQDILAADIAVGMLDYARSKHADVHHWLCCDAEQLPLADQSVGAVFSSLTAQWCFDLGQLFAELKRVLKPGGSIYLATLGPDTLKELRRAWSLVDDYVHVNQFETKESLLSGARKFGFKEVSCEQQEVVLTYALLRDLTYELKALGAHNMTMGQNSGLTGRKKIVAFKEAYEGMRQEGLLPATYQVFYLTARVD